jgi:cell wall-associated NlpC family hydrolase
MSGTGLSVEAPRVRRNWLANAALASVAISVPVGALTTGTAHASTLDQQKTTQLQKASAATSAKHHKVHKLKKKKHYTGRHRRPESFEQVAAAVAKKYVGAPYAYGGTSPAGFDCSGLTQYVYGHTGGGKHIQRTAEDQFLEFKPVSHRHAKPGDLVFFHDSGDPGSYVYHVGVYEGGNYMVAATTYGEGVQYQSFTWAGDTVTFGAIS